MFIIGFVYLRGSDSLLEQCEELRYVYEIALRLTFGLRQSNAKWPSSIVV